MTDDVATTETTETLGELEAVVPDPNEGGAQWPLVLVSGAVVVGSLFSLISASGLWEPPELKVAELARRIAVNLLGGSALTIAGGLNGVPTSGEIGRGEFPFTLIALGFRAFGLSEWAGRLPLAVFGLLGVVATWLLVSRLADRATAAFAALVLATTPLYFLQARTILGDIVTLAGLAIAVSGLALAVFDTRLGALSRCIAALLGAGGMAAGFGARGILLGVAVPSLAIALSYLARRGSPAMDGLSGVFGSLAFALGVATTFIGVRAFVNAPEHQFVRLLGATLADRRNVTHDVVVLQLGHGLFPWSAVVPVALGRLLLPPPIPEGPAFERESSLKTVLLVVSTVAFGAYTAVASRTPLAPFGAVFALAAAVALTFRDLERGAPGSRSLALTVAAFLVLLFTDFQNFPEKGLAAFVVDEGRFPDSFKERALATLKWGTVGSAALFALFSFERETGKPAFRKDEYRAYLSAVRTAWSGNVFFAVAAGQVTLLVLAIVVPLSDRFLHLKAIDGMSREFRVVARFGYVGLPVLVVLPLLGYAARDVSRFACRLLRLTRASVALFSIAAFAAVLSFSYYPALAKQLSPKEVFESYKRFSRPGEDLAMIGGSSGTARYYARREVKNISTVQEAFTWLTEKDSERRWLVVRANDIGQLNSQFRAKKLPAHNIPVLDARSSEILLVSNQLRPGEENRNPFSRWVLDARPAPRRGLDVDFNGQLHAIGWEVTTPDGVVVDRVRAAKRYILRLYYEVEKPISGDWQTFIHIDGYQRRYNGDHETLEGKYPFHLWRPGDFIVDNHDFELEPNFAGGTYTVFFGLFRGDTRLEVKRGGAEDNRVNAGTLVVE
ncbi:MAG TPA: glycosyltransferase family 39 protein [Polyangiaceae bacterium]|nr:glycosyltransferase family 39 protein [Polyangiaceae bacterium]